jgi:hypothetical protein
MRKKKVGRTFIVAVVIGMVLLIAPAIAVAKNTHRIEGTALGATVRMSQDFPNVGSTTDSVQLDEHRIDGGKVVRGAAESQVTVKSGDLTTGLDAEGTIRSYSPQGSLKGDITGKVTLQPDGSVAVTGDIKVTGGTGTFKGATGTLSYTTSVPNLTTPIATIQYSGRLSY